MQIFWLIAVINSDQGQIEQKGPQGVGRRHLSHTPFFVRIEPNKWVFRVNVEKSHAGAGIEPV